MERAWAAKNRLLEMGAPLESALYLLPNAKARALPRDRQPDLPRAQVGDAHLPERAGGDLPGLHGRARPGARRAPRAGPPHGPAVRAPRGPHHAHLHRGRALLRRAGLAHVSRRSRGESEHGVRPRSRDGDACARPGTERRSEDLVALSEDAVLFRGLGRSYGDSSLPPTVAAHRAGARSWPTGSSPSTRRPASCAPRPGFSLARARSGCSCRAASSRPSCRARSSSPSAAWWPPTCTARTTTWTARFGAHVTALAPARGRRPHRRVRSRDREARPLPRHARRHGPHRPRPRGRAPPAAHRRRPGSSAETERVPDIDAFIEGSEGRRARVALHHGLDRLPVRAAGSLGRGVLMRGRWATPEEARPASPRPRPGAPGVPFVLPDVRAQPPRRCAPSTPSTTIVPRTPTRRRRIPRRSSIPLDAIAHWNRLYGPRGFTQYQCVLPETAGPGAARRFLETADRAAAAPRCSA